jgi:phosphatidylserine/phosphatidylglycerophosphate/cardiolipin synthase-like enzyme
LNISKKGAIGSKIPFLEAIARGFNKKSPCNLSIPMLNLALRKAVLKRVSEWVKIVKFALYKPKKGLINEGGNCFLELLEEEMPDSIRLLNTTELNLEIENMFKSEHRFIFILSPYLDLNKKIQTILANSSAKVIILYREIKNNQKNQTQIKKIEDFRTSMPKIQFYCIPNFHSKIYITSGALIITSLNLYEFSQINNFELGVILKETSYNKIILKLYEELQTLFKMNDLDIDILDNLNLPTIDFLFKEIQDKYGKNEKDYADTELLMQFSKPMLEKFIFSKKDKWVKNDQELLQRRTKINQEMYDWAIEHIKL